MANTDGKKGVIGILTGGGDVPGLNPAIRAVTIRALREGYQVIGMRRGWAGLVDMVRDKDYDNSDNFQYLTEEIVNRAGRTGGTFLHTSRTNPGKVSRANVPAHLQDKYNEEKNDLTPEVLENLAWLGIDYLIPIGGDDTLSYGVRLYQEGVKVVAIPKTMDNDVPGTDYCIGFSTCVTRTIQMANRCAPRPARTNASWCWRSSAATRASPPCCPPWPARRIAASFPSTSSTSSVLTELLVDGPPQESQQLFRRAGLAKARCSRAAR